MRGQISFVFFAVGCPCIRGFFMRSLKQQSKGKLFQLNDHFLSGFDVALDLMNSEILETPVDCDYPEFADKPVESKK
jgi:hypothetical protein